MPQPAKTLLQEPDLYYAMSMYEERLKTALNFNLQPVLPLQFVTEFFTNTFSPETLSDPNRPEALWLAKSEKYV